MGSLPVSKLIQSTLVLYLIAWTISPPLQINTIYRLAALGAAVLWFVLDMQNNVKYEKNHYFAILFLFLVAFVALIEGKGELLALLRPINYYMLVLAFLMAYCYKDRWQELVPLIPIVMLLLIYFNYQTYKVVLEDPSIARIIVRDDPEAYKYMRQGVGGYALLYSQVCVLPIFLTWTINALKKNLFKFAIGALWLITYVLYALNSGYTIALVTSIVGLVILFLYKRKSLGLAILIVSVIIALLIWLIGYNDGFRNSLLSFFDGTTVAKKINDIYLSITTEDTADSIMVRAKRYREAINAIFHYPIVGQLWAGGGGGHSALLDTIAKYGVFGGYIFVNIVFGFSNKLKKDENAQKDYRIANATFISILMITFLNSLPYNFVFMIVFLIPMCYEEILKWRKIDEDTLDSQPHTVNSLKLLEH